MVGERKHAWGGDEQQHKFQNAESHAGQDLMLTLAPFLFQMRFQIKHPLLLDAAEFGGCRCC